MRAVNSKMAKLEQRLNALQTILVMVLALLLIQLWLLNLALEEFMAARHILAVSTFLASGACFIVNLWLLHYIYAVDREG